MYSKIPQGYWIGGFLTRCIRNMPIQNVLYEAIEPEFQWRNKKGVRLLYDNLWKNGYT